MPQFIPKDEWELHEHTSDCACEPVLVFKGLGWRPSVLFGETICMHQAFSPLPEVDHEYELANFVAVTDTGARQAL